MLMGLLLMIISTLFFGPKFIIDSSSIIILAHQWFHIEGLIFFISKFFISFSSLFCLQPFELASASERESILKKKHETKRFFEDMEANIINKVCLLLLFLIKFLVLKWNTTDLNRKKIFTYVQIMYHRHNRSYL